ncbi:uncharacterized protein si:dkey-191c17.2 [Xyrauchen texanus]|uniref:uncharacterized protein si:dkey-191c17.2 n=1 Tax=Xyrauchen texanus TaxID=154827 RepID=UPI002241A2CC|nr:uncharacterized protein si:dkey-191c17.2 [Xyrauchen texanus]
MRADEKEFQDTMRDPVKMEYELGEKTEKRLKEMGAHCVEETLDVEYFYDTESFQLASTQTWMNQRNDQWGLILAEGQDFNHNQSEETGKYEEDFELFRQSKEKISKTFDPSPAERSETGPTFVAKEGNESPDSYKRSTVESEILMSKSQVQSTFSYIMQTGPIYTELNDPCSIMMHLSKCLHVPLNHSEIQNMSMENFLNMAQVQIYDSRIMTRTMKYSLPGGFLLDVERNHRIPTVISSAYLMMDADVLNISSELERMERLHKELGLIPKTSSGKKS